MSTPFETEVCSRCRGTGHFSHNGEHSRCYKCDGKNSGHALTKRGRAALNYFRTMLEIPLDQVKIGDKISFPGIKQLTVAKIEIKKSGCTRIDTNCPNRTEHPIFDYYFENAHGLVGTVQITKDAVVRRIPTPEEREEAIAKALEYQSTLTKQGTPSKRKS